MIIVTRIVVVPTMMRILIRGLCAADVEVELQADGIHSASILMARPPILMVMIAIRIIVQNMIGASILTEIPLSLPPL